MEERKVQRRLGVLARNLGSWGISPAASRSLSTSICFSEIESAKEAHLVSLPLDDQALVTTRHQYEALYQSSLNNPDQFWGNEARQLFWKSKWDNSQPVCRYNFDRSKGPISVKWFSGGYTNVCYNALDRHVQSGKGDRFAILWEGNRPGVSLSLTYKDVLKRTCQLANFLRERGVRKGDRVCIYMSMLPELAIAMLACARIGAVHSVVFGGFSAESLAGRILDCAPKVLLTCCVIERGKKVIALKEIVDEALQLCSNRQGFQIGNCIVYDNVGIKNRQSIPWNDGRDIWWQDNVNSFPDEAEIEWMESEESLFMLYTSGSTGKPKGLVHTVGGYMVYAASTFKYCFSPRSQDIFWCTADCGWITGHTYVVYGPFLNNATTVIFEGIPTWPDAGRCWDIVDKLKVTVFYTAPTLIRSLESHGNEHVEKFSRSSLRLLATAGEPIDPKAWNWYFSVVGGKRCAILDTWWQTETGGIMITPLAGAWPLRPGSATLPFFGVEAVVLDQQGKLMEGPCEGYLCIRRPWPGIARTIYQDHERYESTYFGTWLGYYNTGDGCHRDSHNYITITGRVDDVMNVSGHRISTGEIESALASHAACAEAAVVGYEHHVKGQGIYAFVTLLDGYQPSQDLKRALQDSVKKEIGAFASPDYVRFVPGLPKTRSGKVMRHILRKLASNKLDALGDLSTLADSSIISQIVNTRAI